MARTGPHAGGPAIGAGSGIALRVAVFLGLTLAYLLTAPANHSISIDPYFYARMITEEPMSAVPHPRLMLWILAMQGLYRAVAVVVPDPDPFRIIAVLNAALTTLAVMLLARILRRDFALAVPAAWLTAALFATSYGIWRYATEIEVYATSALVSLFLVHTAFGLDRGPSAPTAWQVVRLAALGGIAALIYQPIAIVAAGAIPVYLLARGHLRWLPLYGAIAGTIILLGFGIGDLLGNREGQKAAINFVLQTHELFPQRPTAMTIVGVLYALGSDIVSANWILAFEPLRDLFARAAPGSILDEEIYAAAHAGWLAWVPVVTLPAAAILCMLGIATAWWHRPRRRIDARLAAMLVWLGLHAAMMTALSPSGFEGWLLAVVPIAILAGVWLVAPCVAAGRALIIAGLVGLFALHNGLAGIAIQYRPAGDYFRARSEALIERTGPDDLIVQATNWNLQQYLNYTSQARIVRIDDIGAEAARRAMDETLAGGGRVLILDDVTEPPATLRHASPGIEQELAALVRDYLDGAIRFETGGVGAAYQIGPTAGEE